MLEISIAGKVALFIAVPSTIILFYWLLHRNEEDDEETTTDTISTSRQTVIEVQVPRSAVGSIIGRQGANIKKLQEESGARVNFKDESSLSRRGDDNRTVIIRGTSSSAQQAEIMIRKIIADMPEILTEEIQVPAVALGRIIGRGGENVREISRISKAKIYIERTTDDFNKLGTRKVTITASREQIDLAKALIDEKVQEEEAFRAKKSVMEANREQRVSHRKDRTPDHDTHHASVVVKDEQWDSNKMTVVPEHKDYMEVYMSAIEHPGHFWIQILSSEAMQLDRMTEEMNKFYATDEAKLSYSVAEVSIGDMVAAPFEHDNAWYRAKVIGIHEDKVDLYFVDFGDSEYVWRNQIRKLRPDFLSLKFQAVECKLANVKPAGESWSEAAIDFFEEITYCAQWKVLIAKTLRYESTPSGMRPCLQLFDTNGDEDVDINEQMVSKKHGVIDDEWMKTGEGAMASSLEKHRDSEADIFFRSPSPEKEDKVFVPPVEEEWAKDFPWAWAYNEETPWQDPTSKGKTKQDQWLTERDSFSPQDSPEGERTLAGADNLPDYETMAISTTVTSSGSNIDDNNQLIFRTDISQETSLNTLKFTSDNNDNYEILDNRPVTPIKSDGIFDNEKEGFSSDSIIRNDSLESDKGVDSAVITDTDVSASDDTGLNLSQDPKSVSEMTMSQSSDINISQSDTMSAGDIMSDEASENLEEINYSDFPLGFTDFNSPPKEFDLSFMSECDSGFERTLNLSQDLFNTDDGSLSSTPTFSNMNLNQSSSELNQDDQSMESNQDTQKSCEAGTNEKEEDNTGNLPIDDILLYEQDERFNQGFIYQNRSESSVDASDYEGMSEVESSIHRQVGKSDSNVSETVSDVSDEATVGVGYCVISDNDYYSQLSTETDVDKLTFKDLQPERDKMSDVRVHLTSTTSENDLSNLIQQDISKMTPEEFSKFVTEHDMVGISQQELLRMISHEESDDFSTSEQSLLITTKNFQQSISTGYCEEEEMKNQQSNSVISEQSVLDTTLTEEDMSSSIDFVNTNHGNLGMDIQDQLNVNMDLVTAQQTVASNYNSTINVSNQDSLKISSSISDSLTNQLDSSNVKENLSMVDDSVLTDVVKNQPEYDLTEVDAPSVAPSTGIIQSDLSLLDDQASLFESESSSVDGQLHVDFDSSVDSSVHLLHENQMGDKHFQETTSEVTDSSVDIQNSNFKLEASDVDDSKVVPINQIPTNVVADVPVDVLSSENPRDSDIADSSVDLNNAIAESSDSSQITNISSVTSTEENHKYHHSITEVATSLTDAHQLSSTTETTRLIGESGEQSLLITNKDSTSLMEYYAEGTSNNLSEGQTLSGDGLVSDHHGSSIDHPDRLISVQYRSSQQTSPGMIVPDLSQFDGQIDENTAVHLIVQGESEKYQSYSISNQMETLTTFEMSDADGTDIDSLDLKSEFSELNIPLLEYVCEMYEKSVVVQCDSVIRYVIVEPVTLVLDEKTFEAFMNSLNTPTELFSNPIEDSRNIVYPASTEMFQSFLYVDSTPAVLTNFISYENSSMSLRQSVEFSASSEQIRSRVTMSESYNKIYSETQSVMTSSEIKSQTEGVDSCISEQRTILRPEEISENLGQPLMLNNVELVSERNEPNIHKQYSTTVDQHVVLRQNSHESGSERSSLYSEDSTDQSESIVTVIPSDQLPSQNSQIGDLGDFEESFSSSVDGSVFHDYTEDERVTPTGSPPAEEEGSSVDGPKALAQEGLLYYDFGDADEPQSTVDDNVEIVEIDGVLTCVTKELIDSEPLKDKLSEAVESVKSTSVDIVSESVDVRPVKSELVDVEAVTSESVAVQPVTSDPVDVEDVTSESVAVEPVTSESVAVEPVTSEPVDVEVVTSEPVDVEAVTSESVAVQPVTSDLVDVEDVTSELIDVEAVTSESVTVEPVTSNPVDVEDVTSESVAVEPATSEFVAVEPVTSGPVDVEDVASEPVDVEFVTFEHVDVEAGTSEYVDVEPVTSELVNVGLVTSGPDDVEPVASGSDDVEPVTSGPDDVEPDILVSGAVEPVISETALCEPHVKPKSIQQADVTSQGEPISSESVDIESLIHESVSEPRGVDAEHSIPEHFKVEHATSESVDSEFSTSVDDEYGLSKHNNASEEADILIVDQNESGTIHSPDQQHTANGPEKTGQDGLLYFDFGESEEPIQNLDDDMVIVEVDGVLKYVPKELEDFTEKPNKKSNPTENENIDTPSVADMCSLLDDKQLIPDSLPSPSQDLLDSTENRPVTLEIFDHKDSNDRRDQKDFNLSSSEYGSSYSDFSIQNSESNIFKKEQGDVKGEVQDIFPDINDRQDEKDTELSFSLHCEKSDIEGYASTALGLTKKVPLQDEDVESSENYLFPDLRDRRDKKESIDKNSLSGECASSDNVSLADNAFVKMMDQRDESEGKENIYVDEQNSDDKEFSAVEDRHDEMYSMIDVSSEGFEKNNTSLGNGQKYVLLPEEDKNVQSSIKIDGSEQRESQRPFQNSQTFVQGTDENGNIQEESEETMLEDKLKDVELISFKSLDIEAETSSGITNKSNECDYDQGQLIMSRPVGISKLELEPHESVPLNPVRELPMDKDLFDKDDQIDTSGPQLSGEEGLLYFDFGDSDHVESTMNDKDMIIMEIDGVLKFVPKDQDHSEAKPLDLQEQADVELNHELAEQEAQHTVNTGPLTLKTVYGEPLIQETVGAETATQETVDVDPATQEAVDAEPLIQETVYVETATQETVDGTPVTKETVDAEPATQETVDAEPATQETVDAEPVTQEIVNAEPVTQETVDVEPVAQETVDAEIATQETFDAEPATQETIGAEPATQEIIDAEPATQETVDAEPVAQETVDAETATQETVDAEPATQETIDAEPATQEIIDAEPATQETVDAEPATQETIDAEPATQEIVDAELATKETATQETVNSEPAIQDTRLATQETVDAEPATQETVDAEPATQETIDAEPATQEIIDAEPATQETVDAEPATQETIDAEPATQEIVDAEPATQETVDAEPATRETIDAEPATQETIDAEPATQEIVDAELATKETATQETVNSEPAIQDTRLATQETVDAEPVAQETVDAETATQENVDAEPATQETVKAEPATQETVNAETATEKTVNDETATEKTVNTEPATKESLDAETVGGPMTSDQEGLLYFDFGDPVVGELNSDKEDMVIAEIDGVLKFVPKSSIQHLETVDAVQKSQESSDDKSLTQETVEAVILETVDIEPVTQENFDDEPVMQENFDDEPVTQETFDDEPVNQETVDDEPVNQKTFDDEPLTKETEDDELVNQETVDNRIQDTGNAEQVTNEVVDVETVTQETFDDEPVNQETFDDEPVTKETVNDEPVNQETVDNRIQDTGNTEQVTNEVVDVETVIQETFENDAEHVSKEIVNVKLGTQEIVVAEPVTQNIIDTVPGKQGTVDMEPITKGPIDADQITQQSFGTDNSREDRVDFSEAGTSVDGPMSSDQEGLLYFDFGDPVIDDLKSNEEDMVIAEIDGVLKYVPKTSVQHQETVDVEQITQVSLDAEQVNVGAETVTQATYDVEPVTQETVEVEPLTHKTVDVVSKETVDDEQRTEETVDTEPVIKETGYTDPVTQETVDAEPARQETVDAEQVTQEIMDAEPVTLETVDTEPLTQETVDAELVTQETIDTEHVTQDIVGAEPVTEKTVDTEPVIKKTGDTDPVTQETGDTDPVTQETIYAEAARQETVDAGPATQEIIDAEPARQETVDAEPARLETIDSEPARQETVDAEPVTQEIMDAVPGKQETVDKEPITKVPIDADHITQQSFGADNRREDRVDFSEAGTSVDGPMSSDQEGLLYFDFGDPKTDQMINEDDMIIAEIDGVLKFVPKDSVQQQEIDILPMTKESGDIEPVTQATVDAEQVTQETVDAEPATQETFDAEPATQETVDAEQATQETVDAEQVTQEIMDAKQATQEIMDAEPATQETVDAEQATQETVDAEPATQETVDAEQVTQEIIDAEPATQETVDAEQATQETVDAEQVTQETVDAEQVTQETVDAEQVTQEIMDAEPATQETVDAKQATQETVDAEQVTQETVDAEQVTQEIMDAKQATQETIDAVPVTQETFDTRPVTQETLEAGQTKISETVDNEPLPLDTVVDSTPLTTELATLESCGEKTLKEEITLSGIEEAYDIADTPQNTPAETMLDNISSIEIQETRISEEELFEKLQISTIDNETDNNTSEVNNDIIDNTTKLSLEKNYHDLSEEENEKQAQHTSSGYEGSLTVKETTENQSVKDEGGPRSTEQEGLLYFDFGESNEISTDNIEGEMEIIEVDGVLKFVPKDLAPKKTETDPKDLEVSSENRAQEVESYKEATEAISIGSDLKNILEENILTSFEESIGLDREQSLEGLSAESLSDQLLSEKASLLRLQTTSDLQNIAGELEQCVNNLQKKMESVHPSDITDDRRIDQDIDNISSDIDDLKAVLKSEESQKSTTEIEEMSLDNDVDLLSYKRIQNEADISSSSNDVEFISYQKKAENKSCEEKRNTYSLMRSPGMAFREVVEETLDSDIETEIRVPRLDGDTNLPVQSVSEQGFGLAYEDFYSTQLNKTPFSTFQEVDVDQLTKMERVLNDDEKQYEKKEIYESESDLSVYPGDEVIDESRMYVGEWLDGCKNAEPLEYSNNPVEAVSDVEDNKNVAEPFIHDEDDDDYIIKLIYNPESENDRKMEVSEYDDEPIDQEKADEQLQTLINQLTEIENTPAGGSTESQPKSLSDLAETVVQNEFFAIGKSKENRSETDGLKGGAEESTPDINQSLCDAAESIAKHDFTVGDSLTEVDKKTGNAEEVVISKMDPVQQELFDKFEKLYQLESDDSLVESEEDVAEITKTSHESSSIDSYQGSLESLYVTAEEMTPSEDDHFSSGKDTEKDSHDEEDSESEQLTLGINDTSVVIGGSVIEMEGDENSTDVEDDEYDNTDTEEEIDQMLVTEEKQPSEILQNSKENVLNESLEEEEVTDVQIVSKISDTGAEANFAETEDVNLDDSMEHLKPIEDILKAHEEVSPQLAAHKPEVPSNEGQVKSSEQMNLQTEDMVYTGGDMLATAGDQYSHEGNTMDLLTQYILQQDSELSVDMDEDMEDREENDGENKDMFPDSDYVEVLQPGVGLSTILEVDEDPDSQILPQLRKAKCEGDQEMEANLERHLKERSLLEAEIVELMTEILSVVSSKATAEEEKVEAQKLAEEIEVITHQMQYRRHMVEKIHEEYGQFSEKMEAIKEEKEQVVDEISDIRESLERLSEETETASPVLKYDIEKLGKVEVKEVKHFSPFFVKESSEVDEQSNCTDDFANTEDLEDNEVKNGTLQKKDYSEESVLYGTDIDSLSLTGVSMKIETDKIMISENNDSLNVIEEQAVMSQEVAASLPDRENVISHYEGLVEQDQSLLYQLETLYFIDQNKRQHTELHLVNSDQSVQQDTEPQLVTSDQSVQQDTEQQLITSDHSVQQDTELQLVTSDEPVQQDTELQLVTSYQSVQQDTEQQLITSDQSVQQDTEPQLVTLYQSFKQETEPQLVTSEHSFQRDTELQLVTSDQSVQDDTELQLVTSEQSFQRDTELQLVTSDQSVQDDTELQLVTSDQSIQQDTELQLVTSVEPVQQDTEPQLVTSDQSVQQDTEPQLITSDQSVQQDTELQLVTSVEPVQQDTEPQLVTSDQSVQQDTEPQLITSDQSVQQDTELQLVTSDQSVQQEQDTELQLVTADQQVQQDTEPQLITSDQSVQQDTELQLVTSVEPVQQDTEPQLVTSDQSVQQDTEPQLVTSDQSVQQEQDTELQLVKADQQVQQDTEPQLVTAGQQVQQDTEPQLITSEQLVQQDTEPQLVTSDQSFKQDTEPQLVTSVEPGQQDTEPQLITSDQSYQQDTELQLVTSEQSVQEDTELQLVTSDQSIQQDTELQLVTSDESFPEDTELQLVTSEQSVQQDTEPRLVTAGQQVQQDTEPQLITSEQSVQQDTEPQLVTSDQSVQQDTELQLITSDQSVQQDTEPTLVTSDQSIQQDTELQLVTSVEPVQQDTEPQLFTSDQSVQQDTEPQLITSDQSVQQDPELQLVTSVEPVQQDTEPQLVTSDQSVQQDTEPQLITSDQSVQQDTELQLVTSDQSVQQEQDTELQLVTADQQVQQDTEPQLITSDQSVQQDTELQLVTSVEPAQQDTEPQLVTSDQSVQQDTEPQLITSDRSVQQDTELQLVTSDQSVQQEQDTELQLVTADQSVQQDTEPQLVTAGQQVQQDTEPQLITSEQLVQQDTELQLVTSEQSVQEDTELQLVTSDQSIQQDTELQLVTSDQSFQEDTELQLVTSEQSIQEDTELQLVTADQSVQQDTEPQLVTSDKQVTELHKPIDMNETVPYILETPSSASHIEFYDSKTIEKSELSVPIADEEPEIEYELDEDKHLSILSFDMPIVLSEEDGSGSKPTFNRQISEVSFEMSAATDKTSFDEPTVTGALTFPEEQSKPKELFRSLSTHNVEMFEITDLKESPAMETAERSFFMNMPIVEVPTTDECSISIAPSDMDDSVFGMDTESECGDRKIESLAFDTEYDGEQPTFDRVPWSNRRDLYGYKDPKRIYRSEFSKEITSPNSLTSNENQLSTIEPSMELKEAECDAEKSIDRTEMFMDHQQVQQDTEYHLHTSGELILQQLKPQLVTSDQQVHQNNEPQIVTSNQLVQEDTEPQLVTSDPQLVTSDQSVQEDTELQLVTSDQSVQDDTELQLVTSDQSVQEDTELQLVTSDQSVQDDTELQLVTSDQSFKQDTELQVVTSDQSVQQDTELQLVTSDQSFKQDTEPQLVTAEQAVQQDTEPQLVTSDEPVQQDTELQLVTSDQSVQQDTKLLPFTEPDQLDTDPQLVTSDEPVQQDIDPQLVTSDEPVQQDIDPQLVTPGQTVQQDSELQLVTSEQSVQQDTEPQPVISEQSVQQDTEPQLVTLDQSVQQDTELQLVTSDQSVQQDTELQLVTSDQSVQQGTEPQLVTSDQSVQQGTEPQLVTSDQSVQQDTELQVVTSDQSFQQDTELQLVISDQSVQQDTGPHLDEKMVSLSSTNQDEEFVSEENEQTFQDICLKQEEMNIKESLQETDKTAKETNKSLNTDPSGPEVTSTDEECKQKTIEQPKSTPNESLLNVMYGYDNEVANITSNETAKPREVRGETPQDIVSRILLETEDILNESTLVSSKTSEEEESGYSYELSDIECAFQNVTTSSESEHGHFLENVTATEYSTEQKTLGRNTNIEDSCQKDGNIKVEESIYHSTVQYESMSRQQTNISMFGQEMYETARDFGQLSESTDLQFTSDDVMAPQVFDTSIDEESVARGYFSDEDDADFEAAEAWAEHSDRHASCGQMEITTRKVLTSSNVSSNVPDIVITASTPRDESLHEWGFLSESEGGYYQTLEDNTMPAEEELQKQFSSFLDDSDEDSNPECVQEDQLKELNISYDSHHVVISEVTNQERMDMDLDQLVGDLNLRQVEGAASDGPKEEEALSKLAHQFDLLTPQESDQSESDSDSDSDLDAEYEMVNVNDTDDDFKDDAHIDEDWVVTDTMVEKPDAENQEKCTQLQTDLETDVEQNEMDDRKSSQSVPKVRLPSLYQRTMSAALSGVADNPEWQVDMASVVLEGDYVPEDVFEENSEGPVKTDDEGTRSETSVISLTNPYGALYSDSTDTASECDLEGKLKTEKTFSEERRRDLQIRSSVLPFDSSQTQSSKKKKKKKNKNAIEEGTEPTTSAEKDLPASPLKLPVHTAQKKSRSPSLEKKKSTFKLGVELEKELSETLQSLETKKRKKRKKKSKPTEVGQSEDTVHSGQSMVSEFSSAVSMVETASKTSKATTKAKTKDGKAKESVTTESDSDRCSTSTQSGAKSFYTLGAPELTLTSPESDTFFVPDVKPKRDNSGNRESSRKTTQEKSSLDIPVKTRKSRSRTSSRSRSRSRRRRNIVVVDSKQSH